MPEELQPDMNKEKGFQPSESEVKFDRKTESESAEIIKTFLEYANIDSPKEITTDNVGELLKTIPLDLIEDTRKELGQVDKIESDRNFFELSKDDPQKQVEALRQTLSELVGSTTEKSEAKKDIWGQINEFEKKGDVSVPTNLRSEREIKPASTEPVAAVPLQVKTEEKNEAEKQQEKTLQPTAAEPLTSAVETQPKIESVPENKVESKIDFVAMNEAVASWHKDRAMNQGDIELAKKYLKIGGINPDWWKNLSPKDLMKYAQKIYINSVVPPEVVQAGIEKFGGEENFYINLARSVNPEWGKKQNNAAGRRRLLKKLNEIGIRESDLGVLGIDASVSPDLKWAPEEILEPRTVQQSSLGDETRIPSIDILNSKEIEKNDLIREELLEALYLAIYHSNNPLTGNELNIRDYIRPTKGKPELAREAPAIIAMINQAGAKRYFTDKTDEYNPKEEVGGGQWRKAYEGVRDGHLKVILESMVEGRSSFRQENVSRALAEFTRIAQAANEPEKLESDMVEFAEIYRGSRKIIDAHGTLLEEEKGLLMSIENEERLRQKVQEKLGLSSKYEVRIAFMLFESLVEPEYNNRHFLYRFTQTSKYADVMKGLELWRGSRHWWEVEKSQTEDRQPLQLILAGEGTRSDDIKNALPEKLWNSPAKSYLGTKSGLKTMENEILESRGINMILELLSNPLTPGKNLTTDSLNAIKNAAKLYDSLAELNPDNASKFDANTIWKLRTQIALASVKEFEQNKIFEPNCLTTESTIKLLENATMVMFKEMSIHNPETDAYRNARNPYALWWIWADILNSSGQGRDTKGRGVFEFWKRSLMDAGKRSKASEKEKAIEAAYLKKEQEYKTLTTKAYKQVRDYIKKIGNDYLRDRDFRDQIPEAEKNWVRASLKSLPSKPQTFKKSKQQLERARAGVFALFNFYDKIVGDVISWPVNKIKGKL